MSRRKVIRIEFSREHDNYLYKYLARYCPSKEGRSGRVVFQRLVTNERNIWPWSVHHTWQSWRERYVKNAERFDELIFNYQRKHNIKPAEGKRKTVGPTPIEMLGPPAKRAKLEAKVPSSQTRTGQASDMQCAPSTSPRSNSVPEKPSEPQEAPPCEPEPTDVRSSSPPRPSANKDTDATNKPTLELPVPQIRHDTTEIQSPPPRQPAPPLTGVASEHRNSPHAVKRIKKRSRVPSEVFASAPSSPRGDPHFDGVGSAPVSDTVYPRAPPRVVDSLNGQVLVDRKGNVPHPFPYGEKNGGEEAEDKDEDKARWPPSRGGTAKQKTTSGPDGEVDAHHAFSQLRLEIQPEVPREGITTAGREQRRQLCTSDRRAIVAQFSSEVRLGIAQVESEQRKNATRNEIAPAKPSVPTPPPPAPLSSLTPNSTSKALKFPAPRASTRSPFRPEPPAGKAQTLYPSLFQLSRTKAARHLALDRIRRQTIGHERGVSDGNAHEHERGRGQVPSIDLVSMSRSSTSARSHSHSSTGASGPARPSRWSLPASAVPWVFGGSESAQSAPGSVLGSVSGSPFRWAAPSPFYADIWQHARQSSLGGTSTPPFMFTPSPARSVTAVATNTNAEIDAPVSCPHVLHASSPISPSPHLADVPLAASHGLASILMHMATNHGLALGVVEAVYARVGSLREADEVLRGMREAAEGFGEREIERRLKRRKSTIGHGGRNKVGRRGKGQEMAGGKDGKGERKELRYMVASEDGEGSEYSPPETSRAAIWKRQSESASYAEEEEGEDRDDEEEEGRVVEEVLEREGENEDEAGLFDWHHDFSQGLLDNMRAQELERKVGRAEFRRDVMRRFL